MTTVVTVTFGLLAAAVLLAMGRLLRGPSTLDRIVALETIVVLIVAGVVTNMAMTGRSGELALPLTVALVGFVGSLTVVRTIVERRRHR
ncbi:monovalent cation/H+ antiporter complex subunit F [Haloechinothrix halophila]|uniref:monovalent cation/H+ antiporter complex subunit F n=1 Tax=Haloechinothrix halophila TaxID=1069073 RepID=UPI0003F5F05F|nr:monovalent cation/H+ antiporter complex subunit F [Haloechinothrix halophila]